VNYRGEGAWHEPQRKTAVRSRTTRRNSSELVKRGRRASALAGNSSGIPKHSLGAGRSLYHEHPPHSRSHRRRYLANRYPGGDLRRGPGLGAREANVTFCGTKSDIPAAMSVLLQRLGCDRDRVVSGLAVSVDISVHPDRHRGWPGERNADLVRIRG